MQKTGKATLVWTRRKPTKDGWYFVRYPNGKRDVARAEYYDSKWNPDDNGMYITPAESMADLIEFHESDTEGWWFAGPIPEPEPPKFPGKK